MSINTALGRYFQLAPQQLKAHTKAEIRCAKRGCLLASVVVFEWQAQTRRDLLVHVNTTDRLTKHGQPDGPNATAPRSRRAGLTVETLAAMTPGEVLDALHNGELSEANLEALFRNSGGNVKRLAYLATPDDFNGFSPNRFARCDHVSGYLTREHLNVTRRDTRVSRLTSKD